MDRRVLIDTSAWVEFFRTPDSPGAQVVDQLLAEDLVATTGVVRAELLQGARSKRDYERLALLLDALEKLPGPIDLWDRVAVLGYTLRRKGHSGIGIPDLLVAATAAYNNSPVLTLDKHFEAIAASSELELFPDY